MAQIDNIAAIAQHEFFRIQLLRQTDEDICMYALFPPIVRDYLEERKEKRLAAKQAE